MGLLRTLDDLFAGTEHRALPREELRRRLDESRRSVRDMIREYDDLRLSCPARCIRKGYDLCNPGECRRVRSRRCE